MPGTRSIGWASRTGSPPATRWRECGMILFFWGMAAGIGYVYAGYPVLLRVWARLRARPIRAAGAAHTPGISIVIAARNEGARLPARIRNLLEIDYPANARQIIVASDGSTDDTLERLAAFGE